MGKKKNKQTLILEDISLDGKLDSKPFSYDSYSDQPLMIIASLFTLVPHLTGWTIP